MLILLDIIRIVLFGLVALILGFVGVSLLFSDLGPGETMAGRIFITVMFFLVASFAISYFNPGYWWLGGLVSWGGVLFGLGGLIRGPTIETLIYLLPSVAPSFGGAYLGGIVSRKQLIGRFFHCVFHR